MAQPATVAQSAPVAQSDQTARGRCPKLQPMKVRTKETPVTEQTPAKEVAVASASKESFDRSRIGLTALEEYAKKAGYDHYDESPGYQAWLHWGGW